MSRKICIASNMQHFCCCKKNLAPILYSVCHSLAEFGSFAESHSAFACQGVGAKILRAFNPINRPGSPVLAAAILGFTGYFLHR